MRIATRIEANCNLCGNKTKLVVGTDALIEYRQGALVQDAFPSLSLADREVVIAQRTGFYVCPVCWDNELGSEE